jgi:glycosyltransferase involved in cell wall biosynthesis
MEKIFVIISNATAGIETYETNLIKLLEQRKQKVYLISEKKELPKKKNILTKNYYCNAIWEPIKVLSHLIKIKNTHNFSKISFIISNPLILVIYFFIFKFFFKNKKIFLIKHSHITNFKFSQIIIGFISSILSNFINKVIFVSNFTSEWWCKYFFFYNFCNFTVMHNFIYPPKKIEIRKKKFVFNIGFVGRLDKEKNFLRFVEIAQYLGSYNFKFFVFGNNSPKHFFKNNINFFGWKEKKHIYKKIQLLIVTSPLENCPFNVLEAKSYGIPTLTISNGGIKEIINNNKDGIILPQAASLNLIKNKIIHIKNNYRFFSKNCTNFSKNFTSSIFKKKIFNIF